jgi:hypothetical protein
MTDTVTPGPAPIVANGKKGVVIYLDDKWRPVPKSEAVLAKISYDDGSVGFYTVEVAE